MRGRAGLLILLLVGIFIAIAILGDFLRRGPSPLSGGPVQARTIPESAATPSEPADDSNSAVTAEAGLRVHVVDEKGSPIEGARAIDVKRYDAVLGTTDSRGLIHLRDLGLSFESGSAQHELSIEHDRFAPQTVRFLHGSKAIRVVLTPQAVLTVRVVDPSNEPVTNAKVQVYESARGTNQWAPWYRERAVDARGEVRIADVRPGALVLRALAPGYENARYIVITRAGEHRDVRVVLTPGNVLNVVVRDTAGMPVRGATVTVSHGSGGGMSGWHVGYEALSWRQTTDEDGRTSFATIPATVDRVALGAFGHRLAPAYVGVAMDVRVKDVEVTLQPGASLVVDVLNAQGESVECRLDFQGTFDYMPLKAAGSKHTFIGVPAGQLYNLSVNRHGHAVHLEKGILLAVNETRELTIRLAGGCRVDIRTRDFAGMPVEGSLRLSRKEAAPGQALTEGQSIHITYSQMVKLEGRVVMTVEPGLYEAEFFPHHGFRPDPKKVLIERDSELTIEVPSSRALHGVVIDAGGVPVGGCELEWTEGREFLKARADSEGRFLFPRIQGQTGRLQVATIGARLEVFTGIPPQHPMRVVAPMSSIQGTVLGRDGSPAGALILIRTLDWNAIGTTWADDEGRFQIRVVPGKWSIHAYGEGSTSESDPVEVQVVSRASDISVVLHLKAK